MAKKTTPPQVTQGPVTLEKVQLVAPGHHCAAAIAERYGKDEVNFDGIVQETRGSFTAIAHALGSKHFDEFAMKLVFDRLTNAMVQGAFGAGMYYSARVADCANHARALTNDHRDDDADGVAGFDSKLQALQDRAADAGLRAYALRATAEAACEAFAEITGNVWVPYSRSETRPISTEAAKLQRDAFAIKD